MFRRVLLSLLQELAKKYPILTLLGPRQSGKTTLMQEAFPSMPYVNLEDGEMRAFATMDPKGFLEKYRDGAIFDEVQRVPTLISYIQVVVDAAKKNGMFFLTGSHQADLHAHIAQSLAGRTSLLRLLPLSMEEIRGAGFSDSLEEVILQGGYPRVYKERLPIANAYSSYFQTYVEKDVRQILRIKDLLLFEKFLRLLAARVGQIVNFSSLAIDVGVSAVTIKEWISVLEATYILFRLEPYFENFGKRLIKSPKIYFTDTGLLCYLLGIDSVEQLQRDTLYGQLFENWTILELLKGAANRGKDPHFFFYRDVAGKEVDLLWQKGSKLLPIEIKSTKTFSHSLCAPLEHFHHIAKGKAEKGVVLYGGAQRVALRMCQVLPAEDCVAALDLF